MAAAIANAASGFMLDSWVPVRNLITPAPIAPDQNRLRVFSHRGVLINSMRCREKELTRSVFKEDVAVSGGRQNRRLKPNAT
jgi:hypothetical protein